MSATGRTPVRHKDDFYVTPSWCIEALLEREDLCGPMLDPCCGDGAIIKVISESFPFTDIFGIEKDTNRYMDASTLAQNLSGGPFAGRTIDFYRGDFLTESWTRQGGSCECCPDWPRPATILMNPPFRHAAEFIRTSLETVDPLNGNVVALLRLNFLGSSRSRADLFSREGGLRKVYVLGRRPSFNGKGTDSCEYAFFCFQKGYEGPTLLEVIPR